MEPENIEDKVQPGEDNLRYFMTYPEDSLGNDTADYLKLLRENNVLLLPVHPKHELAHGTLHNGSDFGLRNEHVAFLFTHLLFVSKGHSEHGWFRIKKDIERYIEAYQRKGSLPQDGYSGMSYPEFKEHARNAVRLCDRILDATGKAPQDMTVRDVGLLPSALFRETRQEYTRICEAYPAIRASRAHDSGGVGSMATGAMR